jgi:hypothetical protein
VAAGDHGHTHRPRQAGDVGVPDGVPLDAVVGLEAEAHQALDDRRGDAPAEGILVGNGIATLPEHGEDLVLDDAVLGLELHAVADVVAVAHRPQPVWPPPSRISRRVQYRSSLRITETMFLRSSLNAASARRVAWSWSVLLVRARESW